MRSGSSEPSLLCLQALCFGKPSHVVARIVHTRYQIAIDVAALAVLLRLRDVFGIHDVGP